MTTSAALAAAVDEMTRVLSPHVDADWTVPAGSLEWSCVQTAAHIGHDLTAYAMQLATLADDAYLPLDLEVRDGTAPAQVLRIVRGCGRLLGLAIDAAAPGARAWHWGPADVTGFAAMGMNETLIHTWDIAQGLGLAWEPPPEAARTILGRLFPAAAADDPVDALLRCTGRRGEGGTDWTVTAALGPDSP
ncbi:maleylpyruvate isomerase N-terminal domain-containing protein [Actinoplanes sp. NPDC049265]|uniref:maleylpyruvate isomerase N-terminal domain-containing protein n=1 Tax=Actinoplanes sp. NPDC049265 TaxID=3363902 RepID=UPI00371FB97C